jgi:hypothetical protein
MTPRRELNSVLDQNLRCTSGRINNIVGADKRVRHFFPGERNTMRCHGDFPTAIPRYSGGFSVDSSDSLFVQSPLNGMLHKFARAA